MPYSESMNDQCWFRSISSDSFSQIVFFSEQDIYVFFFSPIISNLLPTDLYNPP